MSEIKGGEPFQKWMQLNLRPELSALGLDPDSATMWDLTNKLSQNIPEMLNQTNINANIAPQM